MKTNKIISLLFSFILSIFIFALSLLLIVEAGFSSERLIMMSMNEQYYNSLLREIKSSTYDYTLPTAIDPSVLDGVFVQLRIEDDVKEYVERRMNRRDYDPDLSLIENRLENNLEDFFESVSYVPDKEKEQTISEYISNIKEIYKSHISSILVDIISQFKKSYSNYVIAAFIGCGIMTLIMVFLIIWTQHEKRLAFRYISYSLGGSALMCIVIAAVATISGFYKRLNLTPQYFYLQVTSFIELILYIMAAIGIIWFILSIIFTVIDGHLHNKRYRFRHHRIT